jgi:hypothetical protein
LVQSSDYSVLLSQTGLPLNTQTVTETPMAMRSTRRIQRALVLVRRFDSRTQKRNENTNDRYYHQQFD